MENYIKLNKIEKKRNKICFKYETKGEIAGYINDIDFVIKYDFDITSIPDSILVIPFVSNVLPIVWLTNANIYVEEIDELFYKQIAKMKKGYKNMIPKLKLKGNVTAKKIVKNFSNGNTNRSLCFFSGGVDSTSSLINHLNENIETFSIWGSDISYDNYLGWNNVKEYIVDVCKKLNVKCNFCHSNFRDMINYDSINLKIEPLINDNYWHAYQHSIAIISHSVPYAYVNKINKIYFPATRSPKYKKSICASVPQIDEKFKFANTEVIHDGYSLSRLDKVNCIVNYNKSKHKKIGVRVCWQSLNGKNCTHCEKCFRTILELLTFGEDPINYNFDIIQSTYDLIRYDLNHMQKNEMLRYEDYYKEIKKEIIKKQNKDDKISWILELNEF